MRYYFSFILILKGLFIMLGTLTSAFEGVLKKIRTYDDEKALKAALDELRKSLLKADVHYKVVKALLLATETKTKAKGIGKATLTAVLKEELNGFLEVKGANKGFVFSSKPPTTILMTGLQGSGKTTSAGKLSYYLKLRSKKVLVAACDLARPAAIEQLRQNCLKLEIDFFALEDEKNPVKVALAAQKKAREGLYDVLIVDTAGRLAIDDMLMQELQDIKKAINPFETFYVADSLTGNDALKTATSFNEKIGSDGIILSKFDGDSKGGVALAVAYISRVPLRFIGMGEKMSDFETFLPERISSRLLGGGDLEGLLEKTSTVIDEHEAKTVAKKIKKGEFNFEDFLKQMQTVSKMGNMKSLMSMIPGASAFVQKMDGLDLENSSDMKKIKAMIDSMTVKERQSPSLMNGSRKKRIAQGSGIDIVEINRILKQFNNTAKMAKKFTGKNGLRNFQNMATQAKSLNFYGR